MLAPYSEIAEGKLTFSGSQATELPDPIAVGAVGGSGTRVLASVLADIGVALASPLNPAGDAMEWPPLRRLLTEQAIAEHSRERLMRNILRGFESLLLYRRDYLGLSGRIGWKVPATFLWLEDLCPFFPRMQYVHLVRHGLDMAYSRNQNQAKIWSHRFGIEPVLGPDGKLRPSDMLEYWLRANEFVMGRGRELLGERLIVIGFENLCSQPEKEISRVLDRLGLDYTAEQMAGLASRVSPPGSLYRYRKFPWESDFSDSQLRRLEALGCEPVTTGPGASG